MPFEFDQDKSDSNKKKHGYDFVEAQELWERTTVRVDAKTVGGEHRTAYIGEFRGKHWTAITTQREENIRLISFRRSHKKEEALYEQHKDDND